MWVEESIVKRHIRLKGVNGEFEGKVWENDTILRAGRLANLEIVLDDTSVSRRHAEVRSTPNGWRVRDLGSTNGTFLNGTRLGPGEWPMRLTTSCAAATSRWSSIFSRTARKKTTPACMIIYRCRRPPVFPGKTPSTDWPLIAIAAHVQASN